MSMSSGGDFMLVLLKLSPAGTRAKKGDIVAEFDRVYQLNRLDDYKAAVVQSEADIKKRMADLAVALEAHEQSVRGAKADMEKAQLDLKTVEVVSDIDREKLKLAAEETTARYKQILSEVPLLAQSQKADLRVTELARDQAKLELQKAQLNVDRMIMKAPMDGTVVMQPVRRGMEMGQVQQGDQVYPGQAFVQIVDPSSMVVNASVNQADSELLRIGMKATVHLDAYPDLELPAHVYSIGAVTVAGRRPNFMRQIPIRLKLETADPRVIPDMSASADVVLATERGTTIVPLAAVFQDNPNQKPYVFVRNDEQAWERRQIELGLQTNIAAAVRSGLKKGEVVALEAPTSTGDTAGTDKSPS